MGRFDKDWEIKGRGNSLTVHWLGLWAFITEGAGSVPDWETKILQALQRGQKQKRKNE